MSYFGKIKRTQLDNNIKQMKANKFNKFKKVFNECISDLYMNSLIIDNPEMYEKSLKESATNELNDIMKSCKNEEDIYHLFENASPYVQNAMLLSEKCSNNINEEISQDELGKTKIISPEDILSDEDKKLINDFEKINGTKDIGEDIQKRVIEVYKAEENAAEDRQEKTQQLVSDLSNIQNDGKLNESVIRSGFDAFSYKPDTVFQAIYMNRGKLAINESISNINNDEYILTESICMYTLLECLNSIGITNMTQNDKNNLKIKLFMAK